MKVEESAPGPDELEPISSDEFEYEGEDEHEDEERAPERPARIVYSPSQIYTHSQLQQLTPISEEEEEECALELGPFSEAEEELPAEPLLPYTDDVVYANEDMVWDIFDRDFF